MGQIGKHFCRSVALQGKQIWVATTEGSPARTMLAYAKPWPHDPADAEQAEKGEREAAGLPCAPHSPSYPPRLFFNFP